MEIARSLSGGQASMEIAYRQSGGLRSTMVERLPVIAAGYKFTPAP